MAVFLGRRERGLEPHVDAQLAGPLLQDQQHHHAADAGEAVAARHGSHASVDHGDVVPVREVLADRGGALRIVALHVAERVVGQHDAPPEGVVGTRCVRARSPRARDRAASSRSRSRGRPDHHPGREPSSHRFPRLLGRTAPTKCAIGRKVFQARNISAGIDDWLSARIAAWWSATGPATSSTARRRSSGPRRWTNCARWSCDRPHVHGLGSRHSFNDDRRRRTADQPRRDCPTTWSSTPPTRRSR